MPRSKRINTFSLLEQMDLQPQRKIVATHEELARIFQNSETPNLPIPGMAVRWTFVSPTGSVAELSGHSSGEDEKRPWIISSHYRNTATALAGFIEARLHKPLGKRARAKIAKEFRKIQRQYSNGRKSVRRAAKRKDQPGWRFSEATHRWRKATKAELKRAPEAN